MSDTPAPYTTVYAFNDVTLEYIGETRAWLSPLEGTYPLPLYAVTVPPPAVRTPYTALQLNAARTAWSPVPDFRGVPLWSTATAQPLPVALGLGDPMPAEATPLAPHAFAPGTYRANRWNGSGWDAVPDYRSAALWRTADAALVPSTLALGEELPQTLTTVAPPVFGQHQAPQWMAETGAWSLVADYRGTVYYDAQGQATTITAIGVVVPDDASLFPPPPPPRPVADVNAELRDSFLAQAALRLAPLQDAVDLDVATDAERTALAVWKGYRVQLNRVDLTAARPAWPLSPDAAASSPSAPSA